MKQFCLIGGLGFIGSHLAEKLLLSGEHVTIIDIIDKPQQSFIKDVKYFNHDYSDESFMHGILDKSEIVINLAYASVPKTSYDNPVEDIYTNLLNNVKLLETATHHNIEKIIYVSSGGTVYGHPRFLPITEEHPTNPVSPYGISKLAAEKYAIMYYLNKQLPVAVVRPSNAYGPGQKAFTGQGFVATAIASILEKKEINIFGENGTIRDYIYVSDLADAIIKVAYKGKAGEIYNIGSSIGKNNKEILNIINSFTAKNQMEPIINTLPSREFDVSKNILSWEKINCDTGWKPTTSLEKGMEKTVGWFIENYKNI
ncbi:MAG: NAD-dependent epimerase/dehydratase family protein [Bacteroidota bacterium]